MRKESDSTAPPGRRGIHVEIVRRSRGTGLSDEQIRQAIGHVLRRHAARSAQIEVAIVGEATIRKLNRRYLGREGLTDVLTFDLGESAAPGQARNVAGQVNVCWVVAKRRAAAHGGKPATELLLYVVHGLLHLLGYDDRTAAQAARMHRREDELLDELGYGKVFAYDQAGQPGSRTRGPGHAPVIERTASRKANVRTASLG